MSLFDKFLKADEDEAQAKLKAWAAWKATHGPPDSEIVDRRGEKLIWLARPGMESMVVDSVDEGALVEEAVLQRVVLHTPISLQPSGHICFRDADGLDDRSHSWSAILFWQTYYEDIEWEEATQKAFPDFFAQRRGAVCETCPAMGKLTMHHKRRSTKEYEVSDLLAAFQFRGEEVDERVLMGEMKKGIWICRSCHDRVHKLEKKLRSPRAYQLYLEQLRRQEDGWLDVDRVEELAKLSPT